MIEPTSKDIGRRVKYTGNRFNNVEYGVISSINDHFVFVRYGELTYGQATKRENLEWADARAALQEKPDVQP